MSEQDKDKPFVINDRRKFRMDGEPREPLPDPSMESARLIPSPDAAPEPVSTGPVLVNSAHIVTPVPEPPAEEMLLAEEATDAAEAAGQPDLPPPPTPEEIEQVRTAYETTSERLDTMMRSQNLGAEHAPPMDFTQLVQSIYMSSMMQLGAGTQQGQQPRVDIIGAKQSIDMLNVIAVKAGPNLSDSEMRLIEAALFELRMGFLEITQMLARQAAAKAAQQPTTPGSPTGAGNFGGAPGFTGGGPRIVR